MLILPEGHWQEVSQPRKARPRDKWMVGFGVGLLAILAVAIAISFTSKQKTSKNGCIDVSAATVIGGSELYRCGDAARALCEPPGSPGDQNVAFQKALVSACRKAGLPVGPALATTS
jgi:hypothetical protein